MDNKMSSPEMKTKWLLAMYIYTVAGAGALGIAMLLVPSFVVSVLHMPPQDSTIFGAVGSTYVAFGILALIGIRAPIRFAPVLLLQMLYKSVWLLFVFLPLVINGQASVYTLAFAVIFISYVIGDVIAIPFRFLLTKEREQA